MLDFNDQIRSNFPRWLLCPMDQWSRVQVNLRWRIHSGLWWRSETQCQCETGLVLWEKLWVAVLCHLPSVVSWQLVCLCWLVGNTEDDLRLQSTVENLGQTVLVANLVRGNESNPLNTMVLAWLQKCTQDYLKLSEVSTIRTFSDRKWTGFVLNSGLWIVNIG